MGTLIQFYYNPNLQGIISFISAWFFTREEQNYLINISFPEHIIPIWSHGAVRSRLNPDEVECFFLIVFGQVLTVPYLVCCSQR